MSNNFESISPHIQWIFSGIGVFIIGLILAWISTRIKKLYLFAMKNREIYAKLQKVNTELNIEYIEELFGKPSISQPFLMGSTYNEKLYIGDKYFLYIIDKCNKIAYYSVTIKKPNFYPSIPLEIGSINKKETIKNLRLGKMKLSNLNRYEPQKVFADSSSKFIYYTETYYFGNPGHYKEYLFGYSPVGYDNLTEKQIMVMNDVIDSLLAGNKVSNHIPLEFRSNFIPNSFAVIGHEADENLRNTLTDSMIGANYFIAREFI